MAKKKKQNRGRTIQSMTARYEQALANGNTERAGRIANRIGKKAMKNPTSAIPMGQSLAQQEFQTNLRYNRPNENIIGGQSSYTTDENGNVIYNQQLSPEQQVLYNQQVAQTQAANSAFMNAFNSGIPYGQAYDFSSAPAAPSTQDLAAERQKMTDQLYSQNMELVDKTFDRKRQQMEQRLYETGNPPGTPGYEARMKEFNDDYENARKSASANATQTAGQEFERSFNLGTQGRQNYIGEQVLGRTQPMSELGMLAGFGGGPTVNPQFSGFQPIQYTGPQYLPYLQAGMDQALGWGAINKPTGGGGYSDPGPSFSFGGMPPSGTPYIPNQPNPITSGFGTGVQQGVNLAL